MRTLNFTNQRLKKKADASSLEVLLNGRWDFKLYSTPKETPKDFFNNEFDRSDQYNTCSSQLAVPHSRFSTIQQHRLSLRNQSTLYAQRL